MTRTALSLPALSSSCSPPLLPPPSFFPIPSSSSSSSSVRVPWTRPLLPLVRGPPVTSSVVCRMAEYKFPDPIPEFAVSEIEKFEEHMFKKLTKRDTLFGDSIPQVVGICTQILNTFLHTEYQGPGTLLVDPFIDMADTIREQGLPGAPQAARIAVKWAQKHVDKDWKEWTGFDL